MYAMCLIISIIYYLMEFRNVNPGLYINKLPYVIFDDGKNDKSTL